MNLVAMREMEARILTMVIFSNWPELAWAINISVNKHKENKETFSPSSSFYRWGCWGLKSKVTQFRSMVSTGSWVSWYSWFKGLYISLLWRGFVAFTSFITLRGNLQLRNSNQFTWEAASRMAVYRALFWGSIWKKGKEIKLVLKVSWYFVESSDGSALPRWR